MEFLIKHMGYIALVTGVIIAILILKKGKSDKEKISWAWISLFFMLGIFFIALILALRTI
ncbi:hypothetical protein ES705_04315 [subsurface metagenome]